jgi:hypothetical protein
MDHGSWIDSFLMQLESCLTCACAIWILIRLQGIERCDIVGMMCRN